MVDGTARSDEQKQLMTNLELNIHVQKTFLHSFSVYRDNESYKLSFLKSTFCFN